MLLLGIDLGTSSVKVAVVDAATQRCLASAQYPETEADIIAPQLGWAEQSPDLWWAHVTQAILKCHASGQYRPEDIGAIGIAYQMHGLVLVDKAERVLRNAIIWCDSRAVDIGNRAFEQIGAERCLSALLNSPGNFTASKLAWVKANEPQVYEKIYQVLLPGDFIALRMTGNSTTTAAALSEGIFWDFQQAHISADILDYFGFDAPFFPSVQPVFAPHGQLKPAVAEALGLRAGIPVSYKAGDQPNNALALNVLEPGEVAATAGTSGVIYGVSDVLKYDRASRINSFAHVNHGPNQLRLGVLLCINGSGIFNRWMKNLLGADISYAALNEMAAAVPAGAEGLLALPFGNGAERMLGNQMVGAHMHAINFNVHGKAHIARAVQEGIAYSFKYGLDIMRENGIHPSVIRVAKANLFLSPVFAKAFAHINQTTVEFYEGDGSLGAALGAGIGAGAYTSAAEAAAGRQPVSSIVPQQLAVYEAGYAAWKEQLNNQLYKNH